MDLNAKINEFLNSDEYMSKWSFDARRMAIAKEDGIDIGRSEGRMDNQREVVMNMVDNDLSYDLISKCTGLSKKDIKAIINSNV